MPRITVLQLSIILLLILPSLVIAAESSDFPSVLKNRKVLGVIYFKENSPDEKLSENQQAEIKRIAALAISKKSSDKIVRVEGFAGKVEKGSDPLEASLSRAKLVWYYLRKIDLIKSSHLYLTGFNRTQSVSNLQGERVEIVSYENPFDEKIDIYSRN